MVLVAFFDIMVKDPRFGPQHLPDEGEEAYVGWVDLMGIGDSMSRSYQTAAVNVGKLYSGVANHGYLDEVTVYPMADGMYLLSEDIEHVSMTMSDIFFQFGKVTNERLEDPHDNYGPWLGFLLRGGLAQGTVYHGEDVDEDGKSDLENCDWLDSVPFGEPIANAHNIERSVAPYGIATHDTVPGLPEEWKWWELYPDGTKQDIVNYLSEHFEWAKNNIDDLLYEESNLHHHANMAEDYFELEEDYFTF